MEEGSDDNPALFLGSAEFGEKYQVVSFYGRP